MKMQMGTSITLPKLNLGARWWVVGKRHATAALTFGVYIKDHMKHLNTMCGENAVFYGVKPGGMVATILKKIHLHRRNIILSTAS
jgi:hypothetical protein